MNNIFLIDEKYLKENSNLMDNVEMSFIRNNILISQDIYIVNLIGSVMFDEIIEQYREYQENGGDINDYVDEKYQIIVDKYIKKIIVFYTLSESMFHIKNKLTNKSVTQQSSDNSTVVDNKDIFYLKKDYKNKAEYYSNRLIEYIMINKSEYPKYFKYVCHDIKPTKNVYQNGWYLK